MRCCASAGGCSSPLGTAVFAFSALRAVRQVVVPLWAVHIGLGAEETSIIFGIATAVDMLLFYPAGKVMDRFGRLAIAIPSPLILGATMMLLPLTHRPVTLTLVAMVMSVGNGIGSGIQMTIGADLAPVEGRMGFLSLWRVWADTGNASGPLVLSAIAAVLTLAAGSSGSACSASMPPAPSRAGCRATRRSRPGPGCRRVGPSSWRLCGAAAARVPDRGRTDQDARRRRHRVLKSHRDQDASGRSATSVALFGDGAARRVRGARLQLLEFAHAGGFGVVAGEGMFELGEDAVGHVLDRLGGVRERPTRPARRLASFAVSTSFQTSSCTDGRSRVRRRCP